MSRTPYPTHKLNRIAGKGIPLITLSLKAKRMIAKAVSLLKTVKNKQGNKPSIKLK